MKNQPVPTWVVALAAILGLYCTATGILGLFDPSSVPEFISGADNLGTAWAGRMAGTGAALLLAIALRSAAAYAVAFLASIFREVGDAIVAASETSDGLPLAVVIVVLIADVAAFAITSKAATSPTHTTLAS